MPSRAVDDGHVAGPDAVAGRVDEQDVRAVGEQLPAVAADLARERPPHVAGPRVERDDVVEPRHVHDPLDHQDGRSEDQCDVHVGLPAPAPVLLSQPYNACPVDTFEAQHAAVVDAAVQQRTVHLHRWLAGPVHGGDGSLRPASSRCSVSQPCSVPAQPLVAASTGMRSPEAESSIGLSAVLVATKTRPPSPATSGGGGVAPSRGPAPRYRQSSAPVSGSVATTSR